MIKIKANDMYIVKSYSNNGFSPYTAMIHGFYNDKEEAEKAWRELTGIQEPYIEIVKAEAIEQLLGITEGRER